MEYHAHALLPTIIILIAGISGGGIMRALKVTPILGYFIAGVVIGPSGMGLINEGGFILLLAEIGVVLLMFDIGLHLSFPQMWRMRYDLFLVGPMQVLSAAFVIGLIAHLCGIEWESSIIIGLGLALSSTAIVMQLIREKGQTNNPLGQTSISILVFQDLLMVFLLVLVPALGGEGEHVISVAIMMAMLKTVIAFIVVYIAGKYIIQPILTKIVKFSEEELFTAAILLIVIATATFTAQTGLSMSLGAFLAGIIISETDFCYMVKSEVKPFRSLLLALFFITVGMTLNLEFLINNFFKVLLFVFILMFIKIVTLAIVAVVSKRSFLQSLQLGLWLSQAGEFGFVLFSLAFHQGLITSDTHQILMSVIGISFLLTPVMVLLSHKLGYIFSNDKVQFTSAVGKVVICGFGAEGKNVARLLHGSGIDYLGIDEDSRRIATARSQGFNVAIGDVSQYRMYSSINVEDASAIVFALDSDENLAIYIKRLRFKYPSLKIFANVLEEKNLALLKGSGVSESCFDKHQNGIGISKFLLKLFNKTDEEVETLIRLRAKIY